MLKKHSQISETCMFYLPANEQSIETDVEEKMLQARTQIHLSRLKLSFDESGHSVDVHYYTIKALKSQTKNSLCFEWN